MNTDEILVSVSPGETRTALLENGTLVRLTVDRDDPGLRVGDIVLGRVIKVMPGIDAAFVDVGAPDAGFLGRAEAFAGHAREGSREGGIGKLVSEGERLVLQVLRAAEGSKGPKLTCRPALRGRFVNFLPCGNGVRSEPGGAGGESARLPETIVQSLSGRPGGWEINKATAGSTAETVMAEVGGFEAQWRAVQQRAAAARPPAILRRAPGAGVAAILEFADPHLTEILVDDARAALALRAGLPDLGDRVRSYRQGTPLFAAAGVDEQVDALLSPTVALPGGGGITIHETEALVAIDVDTGSAGFGGRESTARAVNLDAAGTIARQLALRDLSGHIVIDFVPMRKRANRSAVLEALQRGLSEDSRPVQLGGFTRLGLVELTRQRAGLSLAGSLTAPCPACTGGKVKSAETVALEALRTVLAEDRARPGQAWTIEASAAVLDVLRGVAAAALQETEARLGRPLNLAVSAGNAHGFGQAVHCDAVQRATYAAGSGGTRGLQGDVSEDE